MINNSSIQKWQRLKKKSLDQQFLHEVCHGCNCSLFEAKAVLQTVYQVYAPFFDNASSISPGQIQLEVVSVDAAPSQDLSEAPTTTVLLTLIDDSTDLDVKAQQGIPALRQHRLLRICQEAIQQGGLLTVEDLANRLFNCGERTICRDLKTLRKKGIQVPLRSTIKDMGRTLSHRTEIVRHWLLGKEYSQVAQANYHSVQAVYNYVDKFKRVLSLTLEGYDKYTIAFLVRISSTLVKQYQELYQNAQIVPHRRDELENMSKKNLNSNAENSSNHVA